MAPAISAPPHISLLVTGPHISSSGRFQWRWQPRPRRGQRSLKQRVDLVGRWHGQFQRPHKLRRWQHSLLNSGGRFQWRWQARPRRGQSEFSDNVSILLGDGAGNFSPPPTSAVGNVLAQSRWAISMAMASKTSPLPTQCSDNVSILLGDGAGNFSAATNFAVGNTPNSVAVGDFNGDGKQDLAVANAVSQRVSILLGDGTGNFSASRNFTAGGFPWLGCGGRFQWRRQPRPRRANTPATYRSCWAMAQAISAIP